MTGFIVLLLIVAAVLTFAWFKMPGAQGVIAGVGAAIFGALGVFWQALVNAFGG